MQAERGFGMRLSVFVCVCSNDTVHGFSRCIESIKGQTVKADETVICIDGKISEELEEYISSLDGARTVRCDSEGDHGISRRTAFEACKGELVAVMDSDDVCVLDRFEKQLEYFEKNPETDALGGYIEETECNGKTRIKKLPTADADIKKYAKKRCPFNHMTVMMKRKTVEKAGGYGSFYCNEDYFLWVKLMRENAVFANLPEVLCRVSVGKEFYARRGGMKYFKSECRIFKIMHEYGLITFVRRAVNVAVRFGGEVMLGERGRKFIYSKFLRE